MRATVLATLYLFVVCCSSSEDASDGAGLLESCGVDSDCVVGTCSQRALCVLPCEVAADCAAAGDGFTCGIDFQGARMCMRPCPRSGYACVDGITTACEQVDDDAHCEQCGCADDTRQCRPGEGCVRRSEVGQACADDGDCLSRNCGDGGRCRVPVGAECAADSCDRCIVSESKGSFCSRECSSDEDCAGHLCIEAKDYSTTPAKGLGVSHCERRCETLGDSACGGVCRPSSQGPSYCDCVGCMVERGDP